MNLTPDPERLQRLPALAGRLVDTGQFAGIAWQVMQRGALVSAGLAGHADHARSRPLGDDAIYRLYSMTKPVVSVAALRLVEASRLRLDDPVARWVPGFATLQVLDADGRLSAARRAVTVEDLLTHRAGLSYDFLPDCPVATLYREATFAADGQCSLESLVTAIADMPLAHQPGERFNYSVATDVLAHVIERVCDLPLGDLLRRDLFEPLGMDETDFGVRVASGSQASRATDSTGDAPNRLVDMFGLRDLGEPLPVVEPAQSLTAMNVAASYPSDASGRFARGGIGLFSTRDDYASFAGMLHDGRAPSGEILLSAPMIELLWRNRLPQAQRPIMIGRNASPGYGWGLIGRVMVDLDEAMHLTVEGEGGWAGAASTYFWCDRSNGITGLVLSQFLGSTVPLGPLMQAAAYQGFVQGANTR